VDQLQPGSTLDHYKILHRIGAGGMGVVYEAEDLKLGRHVALKLIAGADPDPTALERFWREARIASALNHPGICTIHEIGEAGGQPFLVMELLEGESLDRLYSGQAVPVPRLTEIGVQLADALEAAHRKGILHRDIKPANIFITGSGQAKILDFGLARIENKTASDSTTDGGFSERDKLTRSGATLGTVAYMSPEQARGEDLDARSDLFSLGVVLYEMATANHPFKGTTSAVVFDKLLNYHPAPAISLNHELPPEFETLLDKALEKDRDLRYQSASDLRADLKRLQRRSFGIHAVPATIAAASYPGASYPGPSSPGPSYPGMIRAGAAAPAVLPAVADTAAPAHLQLISASPARFRPFRPSWFVAGVAILVVVASALAAIQYFARKKAPVVTNVVRPVATATAPAKNSPASSSSPISTPTLPAIKPAPASIPKAKPAAGTPKSSTDAPAPSAPPPLTTVSPTSSFEDDAGSSGGAASSPAMGSAPANIPFRRAFAAAPSFSAHHLHRFGGSCAGTLQLTPEAISYKSDVHSFSLTRDQISGIEGDAIVESAGRRWRLEIPGRNGFQVHNLLARWFAAKPAPN